MSLPVVTVASRGLPVVEVAAGKLALPVAEATNGWGLAVTKVTNGLGLAVVYDAGGVRVSPNNMLSNTTPPPYVASALSEFNASFQAYNSFNSAANLSWVSAGAGLPQWLKIDLGSPMAASSYSMQSRTDTVAAQATAWTLEGSLNNSTWTVADTRSGIPAVGAGALVGTWTMATPGTYRYWRWMFTASLLGTIVDCGNLALYP
jgi:hypothetical protein